MKLYLGRHGETDWNREERIQGQADLPLNNQGMEQAQILAKQLADVPFEAVFCSTLKRARQTARIIKGERPIPMAEDARLMEISFGRYEGRKIEAILNTPEDPIYHFFQEPDRYTPPETAESFQDVEKRVKEFFTQVILPLEGQYETILIVAHGAVNRLLVNPFLGISLHKFWSSAMENCSMFILEIVDGQLHLEREVQK